MRRKTKRALPPRTLRMNRAGRLQSARTWLAAQNGRPANRIARSYCKRYGVDRACALVELSTLGVVFDPEYREQVARSIEARRLANARRKARKAAAAKPVEFPESDETFAYIAGYTDGGAPYGVTWEEFARFERGEPLEPAPSRDSPPPPSDDDVPF